MWDTVLELLRLTRRGRQFLYLFGVAFSTLLVVGYEPAYEALQEFFLMRVEQVEALLREMLERALANVG